MFSLALRSSSFQAFENSAIPTMRRGFAEFPNCLLLEQLFDPILSTLLYSTGILGIFRVPKLEFVIKDIDQIGIDLLE